MVASVHSPKYAPVACVWRPRPMTSASSDGGSARSAPSARPDAAQMTAKATTSPSPKSAAQMNATTASSIAACHAATLPTRADRRTHSGMPAAPATK